ncbi:MAG: MotA/TolQ/ExbB proton channel family protein [Verrucomicrobiales bacterium]
MPELIAKGGPLIWLLVGCSVLSLGIFAERFLYFHRASINVGEFLQGISSLIRKKNYGEALHECAGTPGPVARVVRATIGRNDASRSELRDIAQEAGQLEVPKLEQYLPVMLTVAYVAPMIGLLGTILGMVTTFMDITSTTGFATPTDISKGVYESLITSAVGLAVAIPTYVLYSYLAAYAKSLMHDMERAGIEMVNVISDAKHDRAIIDFRAAAAESAKAKSAADSGDADGDAREAKRRPATRAKKA